MASQSPKCLLPLLTLALLLSTAISLTQDEIKKSAEDAQGKAGEAAEKAKESTESWAEWAKTKFTGTLGINNGNTEDIKESAKWSASDLASDAKDKLNHLASGSNYAQEGKEKALEKGGEAMEAAKKSKEKLGDLAGSAKGKADETVETGKRAAEEGYESAKGKAGEMKEKHGAEL